MIGRLLAALALVWMLGFALFASTLPRLQPSGTARTDGIIVLTGGPGRVRRGIELMRKGAARRMLISGVDRRVRPAELAAAYRVPRVLFARIDLGHESVDTRSNADEAAAWIRANHYRSSRLVTTDWHMPRAQLELSRVTRGDLAIVADAVPSEPGLIVLVREYNKYLLRSAASAVGQ